MPATVRFKVYPLRRRGRRLPWREVKNGISYDGELVTHTITHNGEHFRVATLRPIASPISETLLPDLWEPVLLGFAPLAFRLRGFERIDGADGAYTVVQEWHCEKP